MTKTIPLMLDASILKQVPKLNSELFNELVRYIRAGLYSLYISEIVENEYITWTRSEAQDAYNSVVKATKSLKKYTENQLSILGPCFEISTTILAAESEINGIMKKVTENWLSFKKRTNAVVIPVHPDHGKVVMDAYFSGAKPFSGVKSRNDIPDAFILCSIHEVLKTHEKVIFISGDRRFTETINSEVIFCFKSLSELFTIGPQKLDSRYFSSLNDNNKFLALAKIFDEEIHRKLVVELEILEPAEFFGMDYIDNAVGIFSDISLSVIEILEKYDDVSRITEHSYLVPFVGKLSCKIESIASIDDLLSLNDHRSDSLTKEVLDSGGFRVTECFTRNISGHFSVKFDETDPSDWKAREDKKNFFTKEIEEIEVVLEDVQQANIS